MGRLTRRSYLVLLALSVAFAGASPVRAQSNCGDPPDMLIVLDRSGSMSMLSGSQSKWAHAVAAVNQLVGNFNGEIRFGLMLFPGVGSSCAPGAVNVGVGPSAVGPVASALSAAFPSGSTPIATSLANAHGYLQGVDPGKAKYVLLVTDGAETCGGNPVSSVQLLAGAGITTYVVGFGSGVDQGQLNAMAVAGGTNAPFQADNPTQLNVALQSIGSQVSCCGNGILEPDELCDPAIPQGAVGACPTAGSCNDGDPCTIDLPTGTGCEVTCTTKPVLTPADNDGCCPPGANSLSDNDCSPACGNGVLETGEICDPQITSGPGLCKSAADCEDNDPCTADSVAGSACSVVCEHTALGVDPLVKDGCCPPGNSLSEDADCLPGCDPDSNENCVDLCQGVTCPDGQYCYSGSCRPWPDQQEESDETPADSVAAGEDLAGEHAGSKGFTEGVGCSCQSGAGSPVELSWLLIGGLLLLLRRRGRGGAGRE